MIRDSERRLAALETKTRRITPMIIPIICARLGETTDDAVARHVDEHGPLPDDQGADVTNAIIIMPVAPGPRGEA